MYTLPTDRIAGYHRTLAFRNSDVLRTRTPQIQADSLLKEGDLSGKMIFQ